MKKCLLCSTEVTSKDKHAKFCSRSCSAKYCNPRKPRRAKRNLCLNCGIAVKTAVAIYCSNKCQQQLAWKKRVAQIELEQAIPSTKGAKRYLREKRGVKCEICKDTEHTFKGKQVPIPLILDHIDGNSDNWLLTNLRLVCGRCDMLLPTYKSKNRGNGRHSRRQRYADGKSY